MYVTRTAVAHNSFQAVGSQKPRGTQAVTGSTVTGLCLCAQLPQKLFASSQSCSSECCSHRVTCMQGDVTRVMFHALTLVTIRAPSRTDRSRFCQSGIRLKNIVITPISREKAKWVLDPEPQPSYVPQAGAGSSQSFNNIKDEESKGGKAGTD